MKNSLVKDLLFTKKYRQQKTITNCALRFVVLTFDYQQNFLGKK